MSSATSVNSALADYAAGRMTAPQLVGVVAAAYYGARDSVLGTRLKPLVEIIERAHPGVIELSGSVEKPGFGVRLAERPFPKRYELELREAVQIALEQGIGVESGDVGARHVVPLRDRNTSKSDLGVWSRIVRAVRRLFIAST